MGQRKGLVERRDKVTVSVKVIFASIKICDILFSRHADITATGTGTKIMI